MQGPETRAQVANWMSSRKPVDLEYKEQGQEE